MITIDRLPPSEQILTELAAEAKPVLLGFSRGKDSLAAWLAMREHDIQVVPHHLYSIPGLRFVEDSEKFYEDFFQTRIRQYPHPALYRWLIEYVFIPPERCASIDAAALPEPPFEELAGHLREDLGLPGAWNADGVRAADSPMRRMAMSVHGPVRETVRKVSVVWDWRIADVRAALKRHDCPLPPEYEWFGRSFNGIDCGSWLRSGSTRRTTTSGFSTGSRSPNWRYFAVTSPVEDPNAALLSQLQSAADSAGMLSNDQVMAFLAAAPEPDPLTGVEYTGDLEADSRAELDELHRGFRERAAREDKRFKLATDSEFWFCVCFKSRQDKDAFLAAAGLVVIGDKYLDGYATARTLGVPMPTGDTEGR